MYEVNRIYFQKYFYYENDVVGITNKKLECLENNCIKLLPFSFKEKILIGGITLFGIKADLFLKPLMPYQALDQA